MTIDHLITIPVALVAAYVVWRMIIRARDERRLLEAKRWMEERIFDSSDARPWSATPAFMAAVHQSMAAVHQSMRKMGTSMNQFNHVLQDFSARWQRGMELNRLRERANHFATPWWKRPLYRMHLRWFLLRHYRTIRL